MTQKIDPVIQFLHDRLAALISMDTFSRLWFKVKGKDSSIVLAKLLGVDSELFDSIIRFSPLAPSRSRILWKSFSKIVCIQTETDTVFNSISSEREVYLRFTADLLADGGGVADAFVSSVQDASQAKLLSSFQRKMTPQRRKQVVSSSIYSEKAIRELVIERAVNLQMLLFDQQLCADGHQQIQQDSEEQPVQLATEEAVTDELEEDERREELGGGCDNLHVDQQGGGDDVINQVDNNIIPDHIRSFTALDDCQQKEIFEHYLLTKHKENKHIAIQARNGKVMHWHQFPVSSSASAASFTSPLHDKKKDWETFTRGISKKELTAFIETICGSVERGVFMFSQLLYNIDTAWCVEGLRSGGAVVLMAMLTAAQTMALQDEARLTITQRIIIARILRAYNNNKSVLASEHALSKLNNEHANVQIYDQFIQNIDGVETTTDFFVVHPDQCVVNHLRFLRDAHSGLHQHKPLGRQLRNMEGQQCITIALSGDHGGSSMKMGLVVAAREGDGQKFLHNIGMFEGKENYDVLRGTLLPTIDAGIKRITEQRVLVVEWDNGFDFVLVPAALFVGYGGQVGNELPDFIQLTTDANTGAVVGVTWAGGGLALFDKPSKIPINGYHFKCLVVVPFCTGDLAYTFLLQGRPTYCSARCLLCKLCNSDWREQPTIGELITVDYIDSTVTDFAALNLNLAVIDEATHAALEATTTLATEQCGLKGQPMLLSSIPLSNYIVPTLHIKLGLTQSLLNKVFAFITEYLEVDSPEIMQLKQSINFTEMTISDLEINIASHYDSDIEINHLIATKNSFMKHYTTQQKLSELDHRTPKQNTTLTNAKRDIASLNNPPFFEATQAGLVRAVQTIREYKEQKEIKETQLKTTKIALKQLETQLTEHLKKRKYKPVEKAFEKILQKYGIVRQQYHAQSLIGEHAHRLLTHHEQITQETIQLFKSGVRKLNVIVDVDVIIDVFMDKWEVLLSALNYLCSIMARQHIIASDEECDEFKGVGEYFGVKWREFMGTSVPPKLHLLESHAHIQLRQFGNLGDFAEDPIERLHHTMYVWGRIYASVRDWQKRNELMHKLNNRTMTPLVLAAKEFVKVSSTRRMSVGSIAKKRERSQGLKESKDVVKRNVLERVYAAQI